MRDITGKSKTNSSTSFFYGLQHPCVGVHLVSAGKPADTRCSLEDLPEMIDDRDGWQEKIRVIHAASLTL